MLIAEKRRVGIQHRVALVVECFKHPMVGLDPFVTRVTGMVVGIAVIVATQSPQGSDLGRRGGQSHEVDIAIWRDLWYTGG